MALLHRSRRGPGVRPAFLAFTSGDDKDIKRAASRMSTHRKWYATQNKRANKTIEDALEELRLASLVLQQKQQEEEQSSEALSKASVQLTKSVRAEGAAIQRLRADHVRLEP